MTRIRVCLRVLIGLVSLMLASCDTTVFNSQNGHVYQLVDAGKALSYQDASAYASAKSYNGQQGYLVTISSSTEEAALHDLFYTQTPTVVGDYPTLWAGASREGNSWFWYALTRKSASFFDVSSLTCNGYCNWYANTFPTGYTCLQIFSENVGGPTPGTWRAANCSSLSENLVVEYDAGTQCSAGYTFNSATGWCEPTTTPSTLAPITTMAPTTTTTTTTTLPPTTTTTTTTTLPPTTTTTTTTLPPTTTTLAPPTDAPSTTTETPSTTTQTPSTTTQTPSTTTETPSTTTQTPSTTTETPSTTTETPSTTTQTPSTTTQTPSTTTDAPSTTQMPSTTQTPSTSTEAPSTSTQTPSTTTQTPSTTTNTPTTTTSSPITTSTSAPTTTTHAPTTSTTTTHTPSTSTTTHAPTTSTASPSTSTASPTTTTTTTTNSPVSTTTTSGTTVSPRVYPVVLNASATYTNGGTVTIYGKNFGDDEQAIQVTLGYDVCSNVLVQDDSIITCTVGSGVGKGYHVTVRVNGAANVDGNVAFSRIPPVVTAVQVDAPMLVVAGSDFGDESGFVEIKIDNSTCVTTVISHSHITCEYDTEEITWDTYHTLYVNVFGQETSYLVTVDDYIGASSKLSIFGMLSFLCLFVTLLLI